MKQEHKTMILIASYKDFSGGVRDKPPKKITYCSTSSSFSPRPTIMEDLVNTLEFNSCEI